MQFEKNVESFKKWKNRGRKIYIRRFNRSTYSTILLSREGSVNPIKYILSLLAIGKKRKGLSKSGWIYLS
jgi:hypothetical protein